MSKKQEKKSEEIPLDHITEMKSMQYTVILREAEISHLKLDNLEKSKFITTLEAEISQLRMTCINTFKSEKEVTQLRSKVEALEKENDKVRDEMLDLQAKFDEEKRQIQGDYQKEISRLILANDNYQQKIQTVDQLLLAKDELQSQVNKLQTEKEKIINDNLESIQRKEVANLNKFSNLKKKMMDNINQTQSKVTELNVQFMDVSTKLTVLQNHQLFIQLEYQTQQIEELINKKEALEKKVFELNKDIEIHKEVELSLAEKNKRLQDSKKKDNDDVTENNTNTNIINQKLNIYNTVNSDNSHNYNTRDYSNILALEKKVYNLEKKLNQKCKEYIKLKNSFEYIELRLRNYEKKYAGLFGFFEESLKQLFEDEEIKKNKDLYLNIESLQQGDFNSFTKEEKYSILVILMKYLMPLVNSTDCAINQSNMSNVGLKFHYSQKYMDDPELKRIFGNKGGRGIIQNKSYDHLPIIRKINR